MWFLLCILTLFTSCKRDNKPADQAPVSERLAIKKQLYIELSSPVAKERGYAVSECDGLLWTSLRGISAGDIDVSEFESKVEPGQWFRNPKQDCFIADSLENGSDSTISKDMMLGLLSYLWFSSDLNAINRTIEYGQSHDWVMGQAKDDTVLASKCLLSPGLISILFDIQGKLNGASLTTRGSSDSLGINTGFRAHLDVIHILLSGSVYGAITDGEKETLKAQAEREPRNALFQAAYSLFNDGDQTNASAILLDESLFPPDRLPTSSEYCTDYLFQRDEDTDDWGPCPNEGNTHEGLDFIFATSVMDGSYLKRK